MLIEHTESPPCAVYELAEVLPAVGLRHSFSATDIHSTFRIAQVVLDAGEVNLSIGLITDRLIQEGLLPTELPVYERGYVRSPIGGDQLARLELLPNALVELGVIPADSLLSKLDHVGRFKPGEENTHLIQAMRMGGKEVSERNFTLPGEGNTSYLEFETTTRLPGTRLVVRFRDVPTTPDNDQFRRNPGRSFMNPDSIRLMITSELYTSSFAPQFSK